MNTSGESVLSLSASTGIYGVVKPIGDRLDRKADDDTDQKDLRIFTKFALRGSARDGAPTNWKPDLIFWHGNNFIVINVRDWGAYGIGYVVAECNAIDVISAPPQVNSGLGNYGVLNPFIPPPSPKGRLQAYAATIVSSNQAAMPVDVDAANMILFKNGVLQISPDQFSVASQVITMVTPFEAGDVLVFFA